MQQDNSKTQEELKKKQDSKKLEMIQLYSKQHQQWLSEQTTQSVISLLRRHREGWVKAIIDATGSPSIPDAAIRHLSVSLRNTDVIIQFLTDTEKFATKLAEL